MQFFSFLDGVTTDTTGPSLRVDTGLYSEMVIQVLIGTAASVTIQGQIDGIGGWATVSDGAVTASGAFRVKTMPVMRAVSTGVSGALKVWGFSDLPRSF